MINKLEPLSVAYILQQQPNAQILTNLTNSKMHNYGVATFTIAILLITFDLAKRILKP